MKLRAYQWDGICAIWDYFKEGGTGNPIVAMPTGTGKSLVIGGFIRTVFDAFPNQRVMMLTHVKELIEQNFDKLTRIWPTAPAGIYSSGLNRRDLYNNITFAGIASVAKRAAEFGHIDLVIIDEAHLVSPHDTTMYQRFIMELKQYNPHLKVIGLTATPYRLGHGKIIEEGGLFTDICYDITTIEEFNKLIADGYLAPLVPKRTDLMLNVDGVHMRGGEFIAKELQNAIDKYELTEAAVKEAIEVGGDRKSWLVFTAGVEHAIHTAEILNAYNIPAKAVHSGNKQFKMTNTERDNAIAEFKRGELRALVNNNVLTTGFDHPPIDMIIMLRPTSSPGLWVQMLGRGTRPVYAPGYDLNTLEGRIAAIEAGGKQNCMVLDFGGNTKRLGPINDPVLPPRKGKKKGDAPIKLCEGVTVDNKICNTWVHASARHCPECGNEFQFKTKLKQGAGTEELIKGDIPIVEEFKVDHITYSEHVKMDKPPMLKVTYYANFQMFNEYVCIEHEGFAKHKAKKWWADRTTLPFPESTEQALNLVDKLTACTSLRVWTNKKYPEIMAHCFDGTHFGKQKADPFTLPTIQFDEAQKPLQNNKIEPIDLGDDIPF
jgi:DNA repair protein RadD